MELLNWFQEAFDTGEIIFPFNSFDTRAPVMDSAPSVSVERAAAVTLNIATVPPCFPFISRRQRNSFCLLSIRLPPTPRSTEVNRLRLRLPSVCLY